MDNRKIVSGVRMADRTITDVDELAKVLTPEMRDRLLKSGAISGDWEADAETEQTSKKETKTTKTTKE
jgi:hypothetical protein